MSDNKFLQEKDYKYGFKTDTDSVFKARKGLGEDVVREISAFKKEPKWMLDFRLKSLEIFESAEMPKWGTDLSEIDFNDIIYYIRPTDRPRTRWEDVPDEIKETFDKLGVPSAEREFLAGSGAQFESEMVYHHLQENLKKKGVIFLDIDTALREEPKLFKKYFASVVPPADNKFAALNSAVWSGGSFIYVPKGVHIDLPLQAYFRINAENMGQFERTLIIADEGASVHYVEGCTAPIYSNYSLHAAVVEIFVEDGARVQYTTVQNWSRNVYNLVTKRALAKRDAQMLWVDCNLGSYKTMKYPAVLLSGEGARADVLSMAFAGEGQQIDAGARVIHMASGTSSNVQSKSVSKNGGRSSYRGLVKVVPGLKGVRAKVVCDALLLDAESRSDTYPDMRVFGGNVSVEHEATVSKIGADKLFYLRSRGISEQDAAGMIVNGFIEPVVKELPMEYAVEMNRLVELSMEGSVD